MNRMAIVCLVGLAGGCGSDISRVDSSYSSPQCNGVMLDGECAPCAVASATDAKCPSDADVLVCDDGYEPEGYFPAEEYQGEDSAWCTAIFCETNNPCVTSVYYGPFGAKCVDTPKEEMEGKACTVSSKDGVCKGGECLPFAACEPTECMDAVLGSPTTCIKTPKEDGTPCGASSACVSGECVKTCKTSADPICSDGNACTSDLCDITSNGPHVCYYVTWADGTPCSTNSGNGSCVSGNCIAQ